VLKQFNRIYEEWKLNVINTISAAITGFNRIYEEWKHDVATHRKRG